MTTAGFVHTCKDRKCRCFEKNWGTWTYVPKVAGVPHDHREHVDGCFRCELSQDEVDRGR